MARLIDAFEQFFDGAGDPLVNGQIDFFESGSNTTRKKTFADSGETIENPNPVILGGDGRCPNVFGSGTYRAVLRTSAGGQVLSRDPVGGVTAIPFGADWSSEVIYSETDVVRDDGRYWESLTNNNLNNRPSIDDGSNWGSAVISYNDIRDLQIAVDYDDLRGKPSASYNVGDVITVTKDGITGDFVVKDGAVTDNGGTLIVFTDNSNRYAERDYVGPVSPRWFGATGDGITDDTVAIQAAANEAKEIYFNEGLYLTGPITLQNNSRVWGGGWNCILRALDSADQTNDVLGLGQYFVFGGDQIEKVHVSNLAFRGKDRTEDERQVHMIFLAGCTDWTVENCFFTECGGTPVRCIPNRFPTPNTVGCTDITVKNNTMFQVGHEFSGNGRDAIYFNGTKRAICDGNLVDGTGRQGIVVEGSIPAPLASQYIIITNNQIRNPLTGGIDDESEEGQFIMISNNIVEQPSIGAGIRSSGGFGEKIVSDNIVTGANLGIKVAAPNASGLTSATVSGNLIKNSGTFGIEISRTKNATVTGNTIDNSALEGIIVSDGCDTVSIAGNSINGAGETGILCNRATSSLVISSNNIKDPANVDVTESGISVSATGGNTHDNVTIIGNNIDGTTNTYGINTDDIVNLTVVGNNASGATTADFRITGTVANRQISGNTFASGFRNEWYVQDATASNALARFYSDNIGTFTLQYEFRADGQANSRTGTWGTLSDGRLKENINYLSDDDVLSQVKDIESYRFARYNLIGDETPMLGLIAQDLEEVSPGLVSEDEEGTKSIKQSILHQKGMVAIQYLLKKVDELESQLKKKPKK